MIDSILATFRRYTPEELDEKTLPEICKLFVRAQRVATNHPQLVAAWEPQTEPQNDPDLARDFGKTR